MKRTILVAISVLCLSLTSCVVYKVSKAYVDGRKFMSEYFEKLQAEYEEAKVSRPDLTMRQFMAERNAQLKKERYEKEKEKRPELTYEQFEQEWDETTKKWFSDKK